MTLDQHNNKWELAVEIGGREYQFSALPLERIAELQSILRRIYPHPIERIKPLLEGLSPDERMELIRSAKEDGQSWPPDIGTAEGRLALLGNEFGQYELVRLGLELHHPDADADAVFRDMKRDTVAAAGDPDRQAEAKAGLDPAGRIYSVLLGYGDPAHRMPVPKTSGPDRMTTASIGTSSIAPANNGSR